MTVRVPWALAGFSDPSSLQVLTPHGRDPTSTTSPGVTPILSIDHIDQDAQPFRWEQWQRVYQTERLKSGADELQRAYLATSE